MAKPNTPAVETATATPEISAEQLAFLSSPAGVKFLQEQGLIKAPSTGIEGVRNVAAECGLAEHPSLRAIHDVKVMEKSGQWRVVVNGRPTSKNRNLGAPILVFPFKDLGKGVKPTKEQEAEMTKMALAASVAAYAILEA